MQRFDEVELRSVIAAEVVEPLEISTDPASSAPWSRRLLAFFTDLSLFAALALALSPLLPDSPDLTAVAGLSGFILLMSYYYFAGFWLLWGKTVGGAIFDVRVTSESDGAMSLQAASLRWAGLVLSMLTAGVGFAAALPDRLSGTHSTAA